MRNKVVVKKVLILVVCFFLVACDQEQKINERRNETKEQSGKGNNEPTFDNKYYFLNKYYGIALSTLENNDKPRPEENQRWIRSLTINYPQLYNMENIDKENRLNDMLFKEALDIRDIINDREYIEYSIDYEIMEANEEVISILFTGFVHSPQKVNNIVYTVTIDLDNERFMDLSEFYNIDKSFIDRFENKEFKSTEGDVSEMNELVSEYVASYSDKKHIHDFYIKDEILGLVIPAPQAMNYIILEGAIEKVEK